MLCGVSQDQGEVVYVYVVFPHQKSALSYRLNRESDERSVRMSHRKAAVITCEMVVVGVKMESDDVVGAVYAPTDC